MEGDSGTISVHLPAQRAEAAAGFGARSWLSPGRSGQGLGNGVVVEATLGRGWPCCHSLTPFSQKTLSKKSHLFLGPYSGISICGGET